MTPARVTGVPSRSENSEQALATAVIYLRVSTKEQAQRDGDREGYSIPAQRDACRRKAAGLDAAVVEEFVDRGESARNADRPELQRLLAYVRSNHVDYVIVHKVDRLARNRADDVEITLAIRAAGAALVSCSENIDETPSGILLHGIMSSIAEFYSRNLANEVIKGLQQKAANGGTPGRAPLGYRNVRRYENGVEVRTVEVDPERGPLVAWAFEAYATGEWTQQALLAELARRGLDIPKTRRTAGRPLSPSYVQYMLTNPYYKGVVRYNGVDYDGRHERLVTPQLWEQVQEVLAAKNEVREKVRKHPHYLKGIHCGHCGSRMIVTHARSHTGRIYPYFVCIGRHQKRTDCTMRAVLIERVEELVEEHYRAIALPAELVDIIEQRLREDLTTHYAEARAEQERLRKRQERLLSERAKLLEAHYADAIPLDLFKSEQRRIAKELTDIEEVENATRDHQALVETNLHKALRFVRDCYGAYLAARPYVRRLFNQALFEKLYIVDDDNVRSDLAPPFNVLLSAELRSAATAIVQMERETPAEAANKETPKKRVLESLRRTWDDVVAGLKNTTLVGAPGIEPGTSRV
jgi:site-specific DNA recombinase